MKNMHLAQYFSALVALGFAAMASTASAADANLPESYAVRLPITLATDAPLQRLTLSADALVRLQTTAYNDVRVFNAQGQPVPMALAQVAAQAQNQRSLVTLTANPIVGAQGTLKNEGVSLRISEQQGKRVVEVETTSPPSASDRKNIVGVLLDARAVSAAVVAMTIDADLPAGQPISFEVQASKDLKNWRALADTVLYRGADKDGATANPTQLGVQQMQLAFSDIKDHYLRITWQDASGQAAPVTVRGVQLSTVQSTSAPTRTSAALAMPALTSAHELSFVVPFAAPIAALKIKAQGTNVLIPVQLWGRNDRNQAWTPLASSVVYNLSANGKEQTSAPIELPSNNFKEIKIEADKKTTGFAAVPQVSALFESAHIVFLASGNAPFTLALGLPSAVAAYLPLVSLMPGYANGQENTLPVARVEASSAAATVAVPQAQSASNALPTRSLVLWGVLLLGVLLLGVMAWALMKQTAKPDTPKD
jgi:hypothetical protein